MTCQDILLRQLEERRRSNLKYSLRAFAKDLKISAGRLSDILSGKGNLSPDRAKEISKLLKLSPLAAKDFVDLAETKGNGANAIRKTAKQRVESRTNPEELLNIPSDEKTFFHDWKNLAIWTFITLPTFDGTCRSISKHFKMNPIEVEDVLRRLARLQLISVQGKIRPTGNTLKYTGGIGPDSDLRVFHRQVAALGTHAIEFSNYNDRHVESAMLTIESSKYGEATQKIANFCRSLVKEYGDHPECDAMCGLSLQFFKI